MIDRVTIGRATLIHAPCEDVLPDLDGDLSVVSDPPYLFNASGGGKFRAARPCMDAIESEDLDEGFDLSLLTAAQIKAIAIFCHNDQLHLVTPHFHDQWGGYVVCGWHKSNPLPVHNKHFVPDTEPWVHAWRDDGWPRGTYRQLARYWCGPNGKQDVYDHPTVKPIELMRKIVRNVPGETIVDPFMGTGTTGAAALIEGRAFIGVEKRRKYFDMAVHRIRRLYADGLVRGMG